MVIKNENNKHYTGYFWTDENKIIETFFKFFNKNMQKESELIVDN